MGKYGKKNHVDLNPLHYNICLLGEGGIGKTTIIYQMCEKLVGSDGYIHFDMGREDGASAIEGIVSEPIEDWQKLVDVVDDIVDNKTTDYQALQVVIFDSFDELMRLAEIETIRQHNKKKPDNRVDSINSAFGGFGKGLDYAVGLVLDTMWELKNVGVNSIIIGHVKRTDIVDPITQESYSKLTADSTQRYFNQIKNKMHFVGLAYIDREIVKEKTGRKDIHKRDITIDKVTGESRIISFRDDSYSVDSKSRFANIVGQIPFDCDAFIKAMQDAILAEQSKGTESLEDAKKRQEEKDKESAQKAKEYSESAVENKVDLEQNLELKSKILSAYKVATDDEKDAMKEILSDAGFDRVDAESIPTKTMERLLKALQ